MVDEISLVPLYEENDVYLVLDEIPPYGRVWRLVEFCPSEHYGAIRVTPPA